MGSIISNLSTQSTAVVVVVVGAASYVFVQRVLVAPPTSTEVTTTAATTSSTNGKKGKKKKSGSAAQSDTPPAGAPSPSSGVKPIVVPFPPIVPGGFESPTATSGQEQAESASKPSKSKKKKAKKAGTPVIGGGTRAVPVDAQSESSATAPESHAPAAKPGKKKSPVPKPPSVSLIDTDDTWTRVEPRRRGNAQSAAATTHVRDTSSALGSDAGISTSATGNSSPVNERTEDESHVLAQPQQQDNKRTLAEKLLPKPRKTGVDELRVFPLNFSSAVALSLILISLLLLACSKPLIILHWHA